MAPATIKPRVLIIGGGGAAMRAALAAAEGGAHVTIVSKGAVARSGCTQAIDAKIEFSVVNLPWPSPDTPSTYAADLESIGRGLKSPERLQLFAERSVEEIARLEGLGVSLGAAGAYRRIQLAGSSQPRGIVCPSRFGARVLRALHAAIPRERLSVLDRTMALDVLIADGRATGVVACDLRTGETAVVPADAVVLGAGGAGNVFSLTTNPRELTGDGYALAWRAGAALDHMEFVQYVMLTVAPIRGYFLLTSLLMRGTLVDDAGDRFGADRDPDDMTPLEQKARLGELMAWIGARTRSSPRRRVFWDGRGLDQRLHDAMPRTCAAFARRGVDLAGRPVELALGAHQFLGGVATDLEARSAVPNLFAAGDVADSVQGADRINGSGIMEALVFGALAGRGAAACERVEGRPELPAAYARPSPHGIARITARRRRLTEAMDQVLVVRDRSRLNELEPALAANFDELEHGGLAGESPAATRALHELRSALTTSLAVVRASLARERDLGLFRTTTSV